MKKYKVTGMSCAACSTRVEKAVSSLDGVDSCSVNLLTNSMTVEGSAIPGNVIAVVEKAGYGAALDEPLTDSQSNHISESVTENTSAKKLSGEEKAQKNIVSRLVSSVILLAILMYISMGHVMWGWPLPEIISRNPLVIGLLQLILTGIIMVINQKFFISGTKGIVHLAPNMDTLVALGSAAAFVYSTCVLFNMADKMYLMDMSGAMHCLHELYFESAAMILTLITVGKMLEARAKGKTTDALESLMKLTPKNAMVIRDGEEIVVPIESVLKGDIFIVKPGENIPVDGVVVNGQSAVNESALTGESIPVDKEIGDKVSSGTLNQSGVLKCEALRVGEDTTLSQIIKMVSDASATKAPISKVADKVSGVFVPIIIVIAVIATFIWILAGENIGYALARGISVLVISCPCALGLATPVAIMVGTGKGASNGILFKTATSLEMAGRIKTVALDKTGTITSGHPGVTDIIPVVNISENELLAYAAALEKNSEHPLAEAVIKEANLRKIDIKEVTDFQIFPGNGLKARFNNEELIGGNLNFMKGQIEIEKGVDDLFENMANDGKTPLFFAYGGKFIGLIGVADTIKNDSTEAIAELKDMGIKVVMLTGDNERTAKSIGAKVGVDEVISGVLPDGKESAILKLQEEGRVAMVGDGINDALALTRADVGIAIGAGTDIAIDSADVVLVKNTLMDVPKAIRLSRATLRNIHQNLFWAFFYNTLGIPLAAGVFIPIFGLTLNPMFGAAAMSLSSFCVVTNALRLNFVKLRNDKTKTLKHETDENQEDSKETYIKKMNENNKIEKEIVKMKKTIKIEGMMCKHCEGSVKKALEAIDGVDEAIVSHEKGNAIVTMSKDIENEILKNAVEAQDYKVLSIE